MLSGCTSLGIIQDHCGRKNDYQPGKKTDIKKNCGGNTFLHRSRCAVKGEWKTFNKRTQQVSGGDFQSLDAE